MKIKTIKYRESRQTKRGWTTVEVEAALMPTDNFESSVDKLRERVVRKLDDMQWS